MKDEQIERIVAAMVGHNQQQQSQKSIDISDVLMKIGVGVTTTCIIGVITFLITMGTDIQLMQQNQMVEKEQRIIFQDSMNKRMTTFELFMREPRFSERNFIEKSEPIKAVIANNTAQIIAQEKAIDQLSGELRGMSEDIVRIRMAVDPDFAPSATRKRLVP